MDWSEWTNHWKENREKRNQIWLEYYDSVKDEYEIQERKNGSFTMYLKGYGICDFFPKGNKVLIRSESEWVMNGFNFIVKHLTK